uniref:Chemosensory protein n=1 Tax=Dendrolimus houi TaxID=765132 RepID=A0A076E5S9_9NEOP|nr:chemosensory protein [Dendrolimus houi]
MKGIIFLSCLLAVVVSGKYTDKYDNFDYKEVVENEKLFQAYLKCFLDIGPCTPEGKEVRSHLEEALQNGCEECTEKQKEGIEYCIRYMIEKKPEQWKSLCDKFDPTGKYKKQYEKEAEQRGIKIP